MALVQELFDTPSYVLSKNMKIVNKFQLKIVIFTAMKNRSILHGRVFVMLGS